MLVFVMMMLVVTMLVLIVMRVMIVVLVVMFVSERIDGQARSKQGDEQSGLHGMDPCLNGASRYDLHRIINVIAPMELTSDIAL
jgi:hypothetical protein